MLSANLERLLTEVFTILTVEFVRPIVKSGIQRHTRKESRQFPGEELVPVCTGGIMGFSAVRPKKCMDLSLDRLLEVGIYAEPFYSVRIQFDTQSRLLGHLYMTTFDLQVSNKRM